MRHACQKLILLAFFSSLFFNGTAQLVDTIRTSPKVLFKVGAGFYGDLINDGFSFGQADFAAEVPLGSKFSIGANFTPTISDQRMGGEVAKSLSVRYFINKDGFPNRKVSQKPERTLSGVYFAAVYAKQRDKPKQVDGNGLIGSSVLSERVSFSSYNRYGVEFGRQIISRASVDFAVFAGFEETLERTGFENGRIQAVNTRYFTVQSRFTPFFAIVNPVKSTVRRSPDKAIEINGNRTVFKTGLQDVFSFSKAGIYFFPKLAFELPLQKAPMTLGVKTETYFSRNQLFDFEYFPQNSTSYRSPKPYLNQQILFSLSPQVKYFLLKQAPKLAYMSKIEGFYVVADATARFGSTEVKREFWDFNRFHGHSVGLGGGLQHVIAGKVLLDAFVIFDKPINTTDYKQSTGVRAGIHYSWLRNL